MYKSLNLRKKVDTINYSEEILFIKQLIDGRLCIISGSLTDNKLRIYKDKIIDINNKTSFFLIDELKSPITSVNQCTDESLLILTIDAIITIIKLLPENKYIILQHLIAINPSIPNKIENNKLSNNKIINIEEKSVEKSLNYKLINSRLSTMIDFNSCVIMQLSNNLLFSIYDRTLKFYQVNILNNLYEEVKKIELNNIFNEPLEIDSSTLILLSWQSKTIHFYNIDTQLLLKRIGQINSYLSVKISEDFFCTIGPKLIYLISIKEQEIKNVFEIPGGYDIRNAICSSTGSLICSGQNITSYDLIEIEINMEKVKEIAKIINPHKNEVYEDGIKRSSNIINAVIITHNNEIISSGGNKKIYFWN